MSLSYGTGVSEPSENIFRAQGQSSRSQKWVEQLCEVESRLLANWQEFSEHRSDVKHQLADMLGSLQGICASEPMQRQRDQRLEAELDRCQRRLQQLGEAQEESMGRVSELKGGVESSKEAVEGLRGRVAERLQDLASAVEDQQRQATCAGEDILREALAGSKRNSRTMGDELLRKMEELNSKLGENMASVEEQGACGLQSLRQEMRDVAARLDNTASRGAPESEARKVEARLEAFMRATQSDLQVQLSDLSEQATEEATRVVGLEGRVEELTQQAEALQSEACNSAQRAERAEGKLQSQLEELRSSLAIQQSRLREEFSRCLREAQGAQLADSEERLGQLREELLGSMRDVQGRSDSLAEGLRELSSEQDTEVAAVRDALRSVEHKLAADIVGMRSAVAAAHEDACKDLLSARNEFTQQVRQARQQLEERQEQRFGEAVLRTDVEELRAKHQSKLDDHSEELSRVGRALETQAESATAHTLEWRRRIDQADEAVGQLREWSESREERFKAASLDLAEQVSKARAETLRMCREHVEEACRAGQRQREHQDRSIAEAQVRMEALQAALHDQCLAAEGQDLSLQSRLEALQGALREQGSAQEQTRQVLEELRQRVAVDAKAIEGSTAEARRLQEAQSRRQEALERKAEEASSKLLVLQERQEAIKASDAERALQLDRLSRATSELAEARSSILVEIEASQRTMGKQLEEAVRRLDGRTDAAAARHAEAVAEAKKAADCAERAAISSAKDLLEQQISELKVQLASCDEAQRQEIINLKALEESRSREVKLQDEARGREMSQLKATGEGHHREQLALRQQLQAIEDKNGKELTQLSANDEARVREISQMKASNEAHVKDFIQLQAAEEGKGKELHKMQASLEALGRELRQRDEQLGSDVGRLQASDETFRRELKAKEEELWTLRAALEAKFGELRERSEGLGRELARRASSDELLRKELEERTGLVGRDLRQLQVSQESLSEDMRHFLQVSQETLDTELKRFVQASQTSSSEELRRLIQDGLTSVRAEAEEREHRLASGTVEDLRKGFEDQLRRQLGGLSDQITEVRSQAAERLKQQSTVFLGQLQEAKSTWEEQLRAQVLGMQERAQELHKDSRESASQVSEEFGQNLSELRVASKGLGEQLKAQQDTTASIQKKAAEAQQQADDRLQRLSRELRQVQTEAEAAARQGAQQSAQHQEVGEAHAEQLAKHRTRNEEQLKMAEQAASEATQRSDRQVQDVQQQLSGQLEELVQKSLGKERKHAEDSSALLSRLEGLERRLLRDCERAESQKAELVKLLDARVEAVAENAAASLEQQDNKVHRKLEEARAESAEALQQLFVCTRDTEAQSKSFSSASAAEALRLGDRIRSESESLSKKAQEAKDEAQRALSDVKAQFTVRLDQADIALKEVAKATAEDAEKRSTRHSEAAERLGGRITETADALKRQAAEQIEAAGATAELRRKLEESAERSAAELRDAQVSLLSRVAEVQVEAKQQLLLERQTASAAIADLSRLQDDRHRELGNALERDRGSIEELSGKVDRSLQEQSASVSQALTDATERLRTLAEERASQQDAHLAVADKELRQLREEVPALARRLEATRQTQALGLEELQKTSGERHQQLLRRIQSEAESITSVAEKQAEAQEEWKARHRELERSTMTAVMDVQGSGEQSEKGLRDDMLAVQTELRAVHAELGKAHRSHREKCSGTLAEMSRQQEEWTSKAQRRFDELEGLTAQSRLISVLTEHVDGLVRGVTAQELQAFQRETVDSVEWKLERCVQWLHGANVKLGLNPHGTMFSTDRFREVLFDEGQQQFGPSEPRSLSAAPLCREPVSSRRSSSARARERGRGRLAG